MSQDRSATIAYRVLYFGRVQGVGFRALAAYIARNYQVTGWVRNLPEGRVELWAEGDEAVVKEFLQAVRGHWGSAIKDELIEQQQPSGATRFTITD